MELRIILIIIAVAGILGGGWYVHHRIWHDGYDTRVKEEKAEKADEAAKAAKNISTVEKNYAPKIQQLQDAPGGDGPVGPFTGHALDGLPRQH